MGNISISCRREYFCVLTAARSPILAWLYGAVIDPVLAPLPSEPGLADTVEVINVVHTLPVVGTGRIYAIINVDFAKLASPAR